VGGTAVYLSCLDLIDRRWHSSIVYVQCDRLYLNNAMREEVGGVWRELHEEFHALDSLSIVLSVIK
jgi:hypothetical protein